MSYALGGEPLGAPEILDILGARRRSGKIQVVCEGDAYGFHLYRGKLVYGTSSHRALRLGHLLLQRGSVQPLYLHDILRGRKTVARDQALGSVLVRDGAVSIEDLAAGVEEQAIEIFSRVIALDAATFMYHEDEPIPSGLEIVPLDFDHIHEEAMRRHIQRASMIVMQRLLPAATAELRLAVQLPVVSYKLTDAELLVALNIDRGSNTLEQLGAALSLDQMTLNRTIIALIERGYVSSGEPPLRFDL